MHPNPSFFSAAHGQPKLLCLKGDKGILACRVHDPKATHLLPQRSPWGRPQYSLLTEEKMGNLTAVRGRPGAAMTGPADYFRDLERSDQYLYSLAINSVGIPTFTQHSVDHTPLPQAPLLKGNVPSTKVNAQWFSGLDKPAIRKKMLEYRGINNPAFSESLFPNSGLLEIDDSKEIKLQAFDPIGMDLSAFKARLVSNNVPFQITAERLRVDDEYCAVSYHYDPRYADRQVQEGGGLFLEYHQFAQTITPLYKESKGFVTLAKWDESRTQLELIAITIPFGHTLVIEKDCIHGDTTLNGLFLMCMTSDHISMATADTVFLKNAADKTNMRIILENTPEEDFQSHPHRHLAPLLFYSENKSASFASFKKRTKEMDVIFCPFSLAYWQVKQELVCNITLFVFAGAAVTTAIVLLNTMLIVSLVLFAAAARLAGADLLTNFLPSLQSTEVNPYCEQSLTI